MKSVKNLFSSLAVRIIAAMILILVLFSGVVGLIGYIRFSRSLKAEYTNAAYRTAVTAALLIDGGRLDDYNEAVGRGESYDTTRRFLNVLCQKQDVTTICVLQPDTWDYGRFTVIFDVVNVNSGFSLWDPGSIISTTNDDYRRIYRQIYEEGLERGVIMRTRDLNGGYPHISLLIPVRDAEAKVTGILMVQRDMEELENGIRSYLKWVANALILAAVLASLTAAVLLRSQIIRPVRTITEEARRFAVENTRNEAGSLTALSSIRELDLLASSIDSMEGDTLRYMENLTRAAAYRERISTELSLAERIQEGMLPHTFPPFPDRKEFSLFASMTAAKTVGGDFYDFFLVDDDHLALVMADVSGKGIPGALFMMVAKSLLKNRLLGGDSPAEALSNVNEQLCASNEAEMFVTVWLAVLEISTGKGMAANAGHEHPALKKAGGRYELVQYRHSPVVGMMEGIRYKEHAFELQPGDSLFVYTDGVPEATTTDEVLFGTDRMLDALNMEAGAGPQETLENVMDGIRAFVGDAEQFDDITMLCLKYEGPQG